MGKKLTRKTARRPQRMTRITTVRRSVRYSRGGKKRTLKSNMSYPLALSHKAKLVYCQSVTVDPAAFAAGSHIFSANGMYDSDISTAGHQPYGYDQLMAMYNHYTVIGAKITYKLSVSDGQTAPFWAGIMIRDTGTPIPASSDTDTILEQPGHKFRLCPYSNEKGKVITLSRTFSTKRFFKKKAIVEDALLRGDNGSNPVEQAYFHLVLLPYNDNTDNIGLQLVNVKIQYIAVFTEPKMLPGS